MAGSLEETVKEAYGFDTEMLLVPSMKRRPCVVLTIMDCGDDRNPSESRIVTFRPEVTWLDSRTIAACPAVKMEVSTKITDVLAFTIYVGILPSLNIEERLCAQGANF